MARKVQRKLDKWKSKTWYSVEIPKFMGSNQIGFTLTGDPENLIGRVVETTVGELTNDFSKHNTKLKLEINDVVGNVAHTKFLGHELTTDYLRSIVKRQTSRIDANLNVKTKDGYKVTVKPTCFTVKRARTSQIKGIREEMIKTVIKRASEVNYEQFIEEAIIGKLSANIYRQAKYIYPLRRVEIRKTHVLFVPAHMVETRSKPEDALVEILENIPVEDKTVDAQIENDTVDAPVEDETEDAPVEDETVDAPEDV
ncbi:MAG: 30S ribosomal protein S3ae [Methanosarcinaceae archaeon]|nr:30S ribosomal protein S3ae [Methanosarcinaceae archaeon]